MLSESDNLSRLSRTPVRRKRKGKVKFLDTPQEERKQGGYKGIDLSVLYKTKDEIVYRLTEIYLPSTQSQRNKMIEYNKDKMMTINDVENEPMRTRKRKIKEEMKQMKGKLKH